MENTNGELGELAVLNELAEVRESLVLALADILDHVEHRLDDGSLEVVATLVSENAGEEREHRCVLGREFEAK